MHSGIAIALAWPETKCKQAGAWYDQPMKWIKFNQNNYYKVGHAAVVLISKADGKCHYYDFGRYHAPAGYGRVRSSYTDDDLEINTVANFCAEGNLLNFQELLHELFENNSCHGNGPLHASWTSVSFEQAITKAHQLQLLSPLPYGPFVLKGTNCSRFVNTVVLAGKPSFLHRFRLYFPKTVSPTPLGNVKSLKGKQCVGQEKKLKQTLNTLQLQ